MKYQRLLPLCFAAALTIVPGASLAQVEVGPGGVTIGAHHDRDVGHGQRHDAPVVRENHGNDHGQIHGDAHGGPSVHIDSPSVHVDNGHSGSVNDQSDDHHPDRHFAASCHGRHLARQAGRHRA